VLKDVAIGNTISNITANVFDGSFFAIGCHVVVEPSNKNFLRLKLIHNAFFLIFGLKHYHFGHTANINVPENIDSDDLPDETEDDMLLLLSDQRRVYINDHTSDRLGRGDSQVKIFILLEQIERCLEVDSQFRYSAWGGIVYEFTELLIMIPKNYTIDDCCKDIFMVDWQSFGEVGISLNIPFGRTLRTALT
jgi:hypothetical protein